jgi:lipoteichoic acid synthase
MLILNSFFIVLIYLKFIILSKNVVTPDAGMLILDVISNEGLFMMVLTLMFVGSTLVKSRVLSMVCRVVILLILCTSFFDIYLLHSFQTRLSLEYFQQFSAEIDTLLFYAKLKLHHASIIFYLVAMCAVVLTMGFIFKHNPMIKRKAVGALSMAAVMAVVGLTDFNTGYSNQDLKTMALFSGQTRNVSYSEAFATKTLALENQRNSCQVGSGDGEGKNIILVLVESLSHYHSGELLAKDSYVPNFDELIKKGRFFPNFHANGYTTEGGLIAFLTAQVPMTATLQRRGTNFGFAGFHSPKHSVPKILNKQDYSTEFYTTGDLQFLDKGRWLKGIGFDIVEGSESSFYDGWQRFLFDSAADEALYLRVIDRHKNIRSEQKYFITIENVTTHRPFIDPVSGTESERLAFNYGDRELKKFYDYLESSGFFDTGLLIIAGDHRAMVGLHEIETQELQLKARAMTPMLIIGDGVGVDSEPYQQIDFLPSIEHYLTQDSSCKTSFQGRFLDEPAPTEKCIFHVPGIELNHLYAYCGENQIDILLDGDDTRVIGESHDYPYKEQMLNEVNFQRVSRTRQLDVFRN